MREVSSSDRLYMKKNVSLLKNINHKEKSIMFSGIVEEYAEVVRIVKDQENLHLTLKCSFVDELKIDQSVSHN